MSECSFHPLENKIYFDFWYLLVMKLRQNCSKISVTAFYLHETKRHEQMNIVLYIVLCLIVFISKHPCSVPLVCRTLI